MKFSEKIQEQVMRKIKRICIEFEFNSDKKMHDNLEYF